MVGYFVITSFIKSGRSVNLLSILADQTASELSIAV